jgi:hypothetical protein
MWIVLGETSWNCRVCGAKDERGSVDRPRKWPWHDKLSAFVSFVQKPQVLLTIGSAASDMIFAR